MKKSIFFFLLIFVLFQACKKKDIPTCENCSFTCLDTNEIDVVSNDCIDNWDCNFKVMSQSKVDVDETQGLTNGDKNVFQMNNSTEGNPAVIDDEFTHILVFELDESQNSFSVEDDELDDMQVYFKRICFCSDVVFLNATSGCLQGEKQTDGSWLVQANIFFEDFHVKFDVQFEN